MIDSGNIGGSGGKGGSSGGSPGVAISSFANSLSNISEIQIPMGLDNAGALLGALAVTVFVNAFLYKKKK